jgi:membrane-associated phospholipid phosphatase
MRGFLAQSSPASCIGIECGSSTPLRRNGAHGRLAHVTAARAWLGLMLVLAAQSQSTARAAEPRVEWNAAWPRFRTSEAVVTGAMLLPIAGALFLYPSPGANLHGGILFDDAVRSALVPESRSARDRAATWSNGPYNVLLAYPLLVDTAIVTWGLHGAGDVALEMLGMDLESYAIAGGIALTFQKLGRVRPAEKGCKTDPNYSPKCDNPVALNQSFLSGHSAMAFTGAGLVCAHHKNLPLYGGGAPDVAICVLSLATASATGVLRLMSDNHYATDVLLGVGVGLVSGYALPEWLHYAGSSEGQRQGPSGFLPTYRSPGSTFMALLAPQVSAGYAGVTLLGAY